MQNQGFGDNSPITAGNQLRDNWWIIPSLKLLIEQVEFSLSLSGTAVIADPKDSGQLSVSDDVASRSLTLRNDALKVCERRFRETLAFLTNVEKTIDAASA